MKKLTIFLLSFIFTLFTTSCAFLNSNKFNLTTQMINENVNVYYYSSPKNDLDFYDFQDYRLVSDNYIRFGLVVVENGKGVRNVLSLIKGDLLFAFDDSMTFDFITRTIDGNYLEAAYIYKIDVFNGKKELYDVMGNLLLEKGSYEYINVEVNLKVEFDFFWKSS